MPLKITSLEAVPAIGIDIVKTTFHLIGNGRHRSAAEVVASPGRSLAPTSKYELETRTIHRVHPVPVGARSEGKRFSPNE